MDQPPAPDDGAAPGDGAGPARPGHTAHVEHAALTARLARLEALLGLDEAGSGAATHHLPAWLRRTRGEVRWPAALAVLAAVGLQLSVRADLEFHPPYLLPGLELLLLLVVSVANPRRVNRESGPLRAAGILLVSVASLAVAWSVVRLVWEMAHGRGGDEAMPLLVNGGAIWLTNVLVFALWYWELDRGGPAARAHARRRHPDFLFSQMTSPELVPPDWEPRFVDYLYLSFTNATAFSPTDTLPLTRWAKLTMMFQSGISLVTVAFVVARAVNIFA